jgi:hypothetical protein
MTEQAKKPQGFMDKVKDYFAKMDKKIQDKAKSSCCCSSQDNSSNKKSCCG